MNLKEKYKSLLISSYKLLQNNEISHLQHILLKELLFSSSTSISSSTTSISSISSISSSSELYSSLFNCLNLNDIKIFLNLYIYNLYSSLYFNLTLEKAHILATTYIDEINETDTRALVYGEIEYDSFKEVLYEATNNLKNMKKFIDLGHGIGRAVLVVIILIFHYFYYY